MKNCTTRQTRLDNWLQVSERERGGEGERRERYVYFSNKRNNILIDY